METKPYYDARDWNTKRKQRAVLEVLFAHLDRSSAITDEAIAAQLQTSERAVRIVIRDLRRLGYWIASESGIGYWLTKNKEDMQATIADFLSRIGDLQETATAMERSLYSELGGKRTAKMLEAGQKAMPL